MVEFSKHTFAKYLVEFVGTMFLVTTIAVVTTAGTANPLPAGFAPFAIGTTLAIMIAWGGHVSGAHYNPSVSFAVLLSGRGKLTMLQFGGYILAQLIGGFGGVTWAYLITGQLPTSAIHADNNGKTALALFVGEFLYTLGLCSVVLVMGTTKRNSSNPNTPFAIGMTVFTGALTVGGAFNPAVVIMVNVGALITDTTMPSLSLSWLFLIAEVSASLFATLLFRFTNLDEYYKPLSAPLMSVTVNPQ